MALIGRLFAILFGFLFACLAAGMVVVIALLFPDWSDLALGPIDPNAFNILLGFGFIFVSGFALVPAMLVVAITEAFCIRRGLVPFDPATLHFNGIVRRELEVMTGAGIVAGMVYWLIAGRNAGAWREPAAPPPRGPDRQDA